ncbi:MAG: hypothetical protein ACI4JY_07125 [Oscillospiraceae bacterium]
MTDEELVAWGEKPPDFSLPDYWERFNCWSSEMKKRADSSSKWHGKLVRDGRTIKRLQSHEQIMEEFGVSKTVREALRDFLRHCFVNHNLVTNDKLADIIIRLDECYRDNEVAKVASLKKAINGGYFDIVEGRT